MTNALFLKPANLLYPKDAVAAIIVDENGRYLMQYRDFKQGIFYPAHWGCFGGALEPGESKHQALARELEEELQLDVTNLTIKPFTNFDMDYGFTGSGTVYRAYFEVQIRSALADSLVLGEGREMKFFNVEDLLVGELVVPYDAFIIWLHFNSDKIGNQPRRSCAL